MKAAGPCSCGWKGMGLGGVFKDESYSVFSMFACWWEHPGGKLERKDAKERGANPPSDTPGFPNRDEGDLAPGPRPRYLVPPRSWMDGQCPRLGVKEAGREGLSCSGNRKPTPVTE